MTQYDLSGTHQFATRLCEAMGVYAYVSVGNVSESQKVQSLGGWAGTLPVEVSSRAPHVAWGKLGELVLLDGGMNGRLVMTPTAGNDVGYGWMGAVAQNGLIVGVSKWAQEHDRLLALITLYNQIHHNLLLHHVGFRFPNQDAYTIENGVYRGGLVRNIPGDHDRTYFPIKGGFYREHQWFPEGPHDSARHWDFVTEEPEEFLWFVASAYDQEPVLFDDVEENDPIGMVWIAASSDGTKMGVMARRTWWTVENE
ncbi:hypothetical protein ACFL0C_00375 [Patescibacteria group bacterium]